MEKKVDLEIISENSMTFALGLFRKLSDSEKSLVAGSGGGRRRKRGGRRKKRRGRGQLALCKYGCDAFRMNSSAMSVC